MNEYSLAQHLGDDTAGAQQEANRYIQKAYTGDESSPANAGAAPAPSAPPPAAPSDDKPVLKRPSPGAQ